MCLAACRRSSNCGVARYGAEVDATVDGPTDDTDWVGESLKSFADELNNGVTVETGVAKAGDWYSDLRDE